MVVTNLIINHINPSPAPLLVVHWSQSVAGTHGPTRWVQPPTVTVPWNMPIDQDSRARFLTWDTLCL